jgi:NAD(P)-dependent dehydrogenase (short-subunit alcohol dehydrogenase family)
MTGETFRSGLFADRVALVSGGTSGIGAAIAVLLARLGARVTVTGASQAEADAARAAAGFAAERAIGLDVRAGAAIAACLRDFPRLDILINCAGVIRRAAEHDPVVFAEVVDVNLTGTMRLAAAARPLLAKSAGCIVNTASMFSFFGGPHAPGYAASKGGVAQLTKSLAAAYAPEGIRVNAVMPGAIDTPMLWNNPNVKSGAEHIDPSTVGKAEDVADVIAFLVSDESRFVQGASIRVDGGRLSRL